MDQNSLLNLTTIRTVVRVEMPLPTLLALALACWLPLRVAGEEFSVDARCFELVAFDPKDSSVNLREKPNGKLIRALPNGTVLARPAGPAFIEPGWTDVTSGYGSAVGYVYSKLLHRRVYAVHDPADDIVNFRKTPNGAVLKALPNGTQVEFIGVKGKWTRARLPAGQVGYVFSALLETPPCF